MASSFRNQALINLMRRFGEYDSFLRQKLRKFGPLEFFLNSVSVFREFYFKYSVLFGFFKVFSILYQNPIFRFYNSPLKFKRDSSVIVFQNAIHRNSKHFNIMGVLNDPSFFLIGRFYFVFYFHSFNN